MVFAQPKTGYGAKASYSSRALAAELAAGFAVILLIDKIIGPGDRFFHVSPHPFWILVLAAAVQYGTLAGLVAAAAASALLLVGNLPPLTTAQGLYEYWGALVANPTLWLLSALALGELSGRHLRSRDEAEARRRETEERFDRLMEAFEAMERRKIEAEVAMTATTRTAGTMLEAALKLLERTPDGVLDGIGSAISAVMDAKKYSFWVVDGEGMSLRRAYGWSAGERRASFIAHANPLFREVVEKRRVVCCGYEGDERALGGNGLVAAPIVDPSSGFTIAMVKVEEMEFASLTESAVNKLARIAELVAHRIVLGQTEQSPPKLTVAGVRHEGVSSWDR